MSAQSSNRVKRFVDPFFDLEKSKESKCRLMFTENQTVQNEVHFWKLIHACVVSELSLLSLQRDSVIQSSDDWVALFLPVIVKRVRKRLAWSQSDIARRVSEISGRPVDKTTISRLENQKRNPISIDLLEVLCRVFGIQLSDLFRYGEDLLIFESLPTDSQAKVMKSVIEKVEVVEDEKMNC